MRTEHDVRRRAALVLRELGIADSVAGVQPRESAALREVLAEIVARIAPGERFQRFMSALNAYHPAHRRAERGEQGQWTYSEQPPDGRIAYWCADCRVYVEPKSWSRDRWAVAMLAHVVSIAHIARVEGREAARKRGAA